MPSAHVDRLNGLPYAGFLSNTFTDLFPFLLAICRSVVCCPSLVTLTCGQMLDSGTGGDRWHSEQRGFNSRLPLTLSLSLYLPPSISFPLYLTLYLSHYISLIICISLYLSHYISLTLSLLFYLSHYIYLTISLSLYFSHFISPTLSLPLYLSHSISFTICIFLHVSHPIYLTQYLSFYIISLFFLASCLYPVIVLGYSHI